MAYQVLYRTYRPQRFEEVVGQEYIIKTLKNAIKLNKIAHAYLFAGPRGTGKTTVAKLFAKAINCEKFNGESCDKCNSCETYNNANHPDIIEMDAASKSRVEDIREILDEVPYAPLVGKYKVYIIDEVHMLSTSAFNALLKTLEEPPTHVIFILATTDPQKVIPTVLSRCQRYNFSKITNLDIVNKMKEILNKESISYEDKALEEVASLADGGMRDALSILEQILAYSGDGITLDDVQKIFGLSSKEEKVNLLVNIHSSSCDESIKILRDMYQSGVDPKRLAIDLLNIVKETLIYSDAGRDTLLNKIDAADASKIYSCTNKQILLNDLIALEECITRNSNQNFLTYLELCLIKMASENIDVTPKKKEVVEEVKEEAQKEIEIQKPEIKEELPEEKTEEIHEEKEESIDSSIDFLARVLMSASKDIKVADAVIFNRLELYKFEADKRKFYELLTGTEIFASSADAIIITANKTKASSINSRVMNEELYNFINSEFGIDKMVFAISNEEKQLLINKYRELVSKGIKDSVIIKKYEIKKELSTEDKLRDMFGDVVIE